MIKKITLSLILFCMMVSCGKKADPVFKDLEKKVKLQTTFISKI